MKSRFIFPKWLRILAGILVLVAVDPIQAQASTASEVIENFHQALIQVMQQEDELDYAARRQHLAPFVGGDFDATFMTRVAAGSNWKGFSDDQKTALTNAFREMTLANYASRFHGYSGQRFETLSEREVRGGRLFVRTKLVKADGEEVRIDYLMRSRGEDWLIIDVFVDGKFSELAMRRAEFSPILRDKGYEGLIEVINTKVADLEAGKGAD